MARPLLTARHYMAIAKVLRFERDAAQTVDALVALDNTVAAFDAAFKVDNPNYNSDKFLGAIYVKNVEKYEYRAYRKNGDSIEIGETVADFRGREWIFEGVSQAPKMGKSGKILVRDPERDYSREFYPTVFNVEIR